MQHFAFCILHFALRSLSLVVNCLSFSHLYIHRTQSDTRQRAFKQDADCSASVPNRSNSDNSSGGGGDCQTGLCYGQQL